MSEILALEAKVSMSVNSSNGREIYTLCILKTSRIYNLARWMFEFTVYYSFRFELNFFLCFCSSIVLLFVYNCREPSCWKRTIN